MRCRSVVLAVLWCTLFFPVRLNAQVTVSDIAIEARIQDDFGGHFKRGRALVAADFDQDGRVDFYIGNPGDESLVYRNVEKAGRTQFLMSQVLLKGDLAWGAAAADYDNDGDPDLYITTGANEGTGLDYLFQNQFAETGVLTFVDVSATAGVQGPPDELGAPLETATANAAWGDYDNDGLTDLFVSANLWNGDNMDAPDLLRRTEPLRPTPSSTATYIPGQNLLYHNNGDGTFTEVAQSLGLTNVAATRHATWLDIDNDGDLDLFESNYDGFNLLWQNQLIESGTPTFADVTTPFSLAGEDLRYPVLTFVSCAADFNQDGWEDLIAFMRNGGPAERDGPYGDGHALFLNEQGTGFRNVAHTSAAAINLNYVSGLNLGVMGSQIGDLNADGTPDIYIGNGGPVNDFPDQFFMSTSAPGTDPTYADWTAEINFQAPQNPHTVAFYPSYPYRTHGTAMVDVDGDGLLELAVVNGGPAFNLNDDDVQQPNRLFKFEGWDPVPNFFKVRLVGDGVNVSRDAIGARVNVRAGGQGIGTWQLYETVRGGSCFSAQNGFDLFFGLGSATNIAQLEVTWPDGTTTTVPGGLTVNTTAEVTYGVGLTNVIQPRTASAAAPSLDAPLTEAEPHTAFTLDAAYPNPFNPSTRLRFTLPEAADVRLTVFDALGRAVTTLAEGLHPAGTHTVRFEGDGLPSGVYLYRLEAGGVVQTETMLLLK